MSANVIRIETENDLLFLKDNEIHVFANAIEYVYKPSLIKKMAIITSLKESGSIEKSLVLYIGDDTEIYIKNDHKCFQPFLFNQIRTKLPVNSKKILDALACTSNNTSMIYNYKQGVLSIVSFSIWVLSIAIVIVNLSTHLSFKIILVALGISIIGFVLDIIAYLDNPDSKLAVNVMTVYIVNYGLVISLVILYFTCIAAIGETINYFCGSCEGMP
ncbi:hypothetical protein [Butyrivibrio sp. M55]|uniref:hypothetical protein n=1 Tax=Butyrivibrio sp. M55 TaxID=1855323 RepID=UPI0008DFFD82|nr:hypothetical protein [Butyrivibrio sp. M55]SFU91891.1 hypothetical protein SAMN05216540_12124 [Butyrivibrio sp. M55]